MNRDDWQNYWQYTEPQGMPWNIDRPDHNLVTWLMHATKRPRRALEIGCGNGENAIWMAQQGISVTATDIAKAALEEGKMRAHKRKVRVTWQCVDAVLEPLPQGPFDLVFDRGMFHGSHQAERREAIAANIAKVLAPQGIWLSIIGSTEMCQHIHQTPPRRSASEIVTAVEPHLRIDRLETCTEEMMTEQGLMHCSAWLLMARRRDVPARVKHIADVP